MPDSIFKEKGSSGEDKNENINENVAIRIKPNAL